MNEVSDKLVSDKSGATAHTYIRTYGCAGWGPTAKTPMYADTTAVPITDSAQRVTHQSIYSVVCSCQ
jgi:hypothetical protein